MKKIIIICLSAAAVIAAMLAALIWFWFIRELPTLDATLSAPSEVEMGSTLTLKITTTNSHNKPVTLDSIDIDDAFLKGFQVVKINPAPSGTTHIPFTQQRSWDFGKAVSPRGAFSVTFQLKAVADGHFSGDVDVCNPNQDFKTLLADVVVTKKSSHKIGNANGSQTIRSETNRPSSAAGSRR